MKNFLLGILIFGVFNFGFSQKKELKTADKQIKSGEYSQAITTLESIEDLIFGCANQAGEDNRNVARMAGLLAGLPVSVGGETVNRLCASGMASTINAARAIKDNAGDIYISGGVEHMTRGPWVISKASKPFGRDSQMHDSSFGWRFINPKMKKLIELKRNKVINKTEKQILKI